jgi:hypothetical protein
MRGGGPPFIGGEEGVFLGIFPGSPHMERINRLCIEFAANTT